MIVCVVLHTDTLINVVYLHIVRAETECAPIISSLIGKKKLHACSFLTPMQVTWMRPNNQMRPVLGSGRETQRVQAIG